MLLKREFEYRTDEDYGTDGWAPMWIHTANTGGGLLVAHDVMEHLAKNCPCPYADELQALGASLYVRQFDWYYETMPGNRNAPAVHVASTIVRDVVLESFYLGTRLLSAPRTRACEAESDITEVMDACVPLVRDETVHVDETEQLRRWWRDMQPDCRGWLRIGWRTARKRYCKMPQHKLRDVFNNITARVDRMHGELYDRLEVVVDSCTGAVRVSTRAQH